MSNCTVLPSLFPVFCKLNLMDLTLFLFSNEPYWNSNKRKKDLEFDPLENRMRNNKFEPTLGINVQGLSFEKFICFYFCAWVVFSMYVWAPRQACLVPEEARRRYQVVLDWGSRWLWTTTWTLGIESKRLANAANAVNLWPSLRLLFLRQLKNWNHLSSVN